MLINDLMNVQEISDAFEDIASDINILFDTVMLELDNEKDLRSKGNGRLSKQDFETLEELWGTLNNITCYI